jgi:hypothetical protein
MKRPEDWDISKIIGGIVLSLVMLSLGINGAVKGWAFEKDLLPLKGKLEKSEITTTIVTDNRNNKSYVSELVFTLRDVNRSFELKHNTGSDYKDKDYISLKTKLRMADSVTVWIDKQDEAYAPKVFQIQADKLSILSLDDTRIDWADRFLIIMGLLFFSVSITSLYLHLRAKGKLKLGNTVN